MDNEFHLSDVAPERFLCYYRIFWCYHVTVLNMHFYGDKKFQQNYTWIAHVIFYYHSKFEMQQKLIQDATSNPNVTSRPLSMLHTTIVRLLIKRSDTFVMY